MIEIMAKVLLGAALYVSVLSLAQRNPRAAGMMLTFPALNGVSMLMANPADMDQVVSTMLMLPVVNALLCIAYLFAIQHRLALNRAGTMHLTWLLLAMALLWAIWATMAARHHWSIPSTTQPIYVATVLFIALLALATPMSGRLTPRNSAEPMSLASFLIRNSKSIALFAAALAAVLIAERVDQSAALRGILAGLPLVPFFSLHAIVTGHTPATAARHEKLACVLKGVWIGPAVAVAFIFGYRHWLLTLAGNSSGAHYLTVGIIALLASWGLCAVAIWACDRLLHRSPHR